AQVGGLVSRNKWCQQGENHCETQHPGEPLARFRSLIRHDGFSRLASSIPGSMLPTTWETHRKGWGNKPASCIQRLIVVAAATRNQGSIFTPLSGSLQTASQASS